ncbi:MAG: bifunctional riboflavin kinase/FAD synthetase [Clostridiales bacterium]|nr:bifunctional riboflavin kinase/FAD synthetase [Clostridiales bacterium]
MCDSKKVVALGFFDGVHLGHATLLNRAKEVAGELGLEPAMLTFDRHPDELVGGKPVALINSAEDRKYIVSRWFGINKIITIHFDRDMMQMPWRDFVDMVIENYGAAHFVVGHDFRFGFKGQGTAEKLKELGEERGFGCDIMPKVELDGVTVSSTYIRELVAEGRIEEANRFLGHPHLVTGTVRHGFKLGRKLGTPTINQKFEENIIVPRKGVYAAKLGLIGEERLYPAVTNIGVRPTVSGGSSVSVESYLLNFDRDVYDKSVVCEFYAFMRPEMKFGSVDELGERIKADAQTAKKIVENM